MIQKKVEVFNLHEFLESQLAARHGYEEQFQPPDEVIDKLEALWKNIVLPIREYLCQGTVSITSGWRCARLNKKAGGSKTSQHMIGEAVDLEYYFDGKECNTEIINALIALDLDFDQCIDEFGQRWVHISFTQRRKNRRLRLKSYKNSEGKTVYEQV